MCTQRGKCNLWILDSLKKQTYSSKYWKVFLIADNCTDNTVKSTEKYDFVTIYEHKTDEGAKRKGIALNIEMYIIAFFAAKQSGLSIRKMLLYYRKVR